MLGFFFFFFFVFLVAVESHSSHSSAAAVAVAVAVVIAVAVPVAAAVAVAVAVAADVAPTKQMYTQRSSSQQPIMWYSYGGTINEVWCPHKVSKGSGLFLLLLLLLLLLTLGFRVCTLCEQAEVLGFSDVQRSTGL